MNRLYKKNEIHASSKVTSLVDEKYGPFYFDQPVDHSDISAGTFKHRYWANTDWYQAGGPVILYNAGEADAIGRAIYVTNSSMALLAEQLHGVVIVMEHRCYGESQLGTDYSVQYLRTLNTEQALEDMANIIKKVKLPNLELPAAPETKWIVYGGSYSGNLAAWMRYRYPDIVFAAVPSSAPVQMKYNYYEYFYPIQKYGPKHCIQAIEQVISYVDHILFSPFQEPKRRLKETFGAKDLKHDDDFANLLMFPLGLWQAMTPTSNPFETEFCSVFDGMNNLHGYIEAYAGYIGNITEKMCHEYSSVNECLDSHDPKAPMYNDLKSPSRPWVWQICTEYAYWQTGTPNWISGTIVSRKLDTKWYQRQCPLFFGEHNIPVRPQWRYINKEYQGWNIKLNRTFWIDGEYDPWRTLSVQSDWAPERGNNDHNKKQDNARYVVLPQSVHHWDFFVSDYVSDDIRQVQKDLFTTISGWITEADADTENYNDN
ncbi:hypothetical protein INT45_013704 [Circinella minor]|uniref:Uncharacterized protein n=1 Tax=Circinella minor TaxID=1195481 RepID=A0A8H7VR05_9FUNG|nr:hypothetical protein INT45_013704 [Circinella minor]